ncbi:DUF2283 domain-containing protein [Candidatus Pacearchaeota archaeon]|nr:DUF2283 domain-containing protein [Candidatus Pacearchaeota archaeon]
MNRVLNKAGEYDYDFKNDIFFFKVKDREYSHSIELHNLVIDFDKEDFIVGLQIFDASTIFNLSKENLRQVQHFEMQSNVNQGRIQVNLSFNLKIRNRQVSYNPIIFEKIEDKIPNSELSCVA